MPSSEVLLVETQRCSRSVGPRHGATHIHVGGALRPTAGLRSLSGPCLFPLLPQASRAQILDKATEYIQYMRRKNHTHQQDIDDLKRQNALLEQQGELLPPPPSTHRKGIQRPCPSPPWPVTPPCLAVRALEKARSSAQLQANYPAADSSLYTNPKGSTIYAFDGGSDSSSDSEPDEPQSRKKLRMEAS